MVGCPPCQVMVPWKDGKIPGKICPGFCEKKCTKTQTEGFGKVKKGMKNEER